MSLSVDIRKKLEGFTLDIAFRTENRVTGLLGASGSGKSMTLKCIAGIEQPDEGRIVLNERVLYDSEKGINLTPQKRRVGYLFQNYALFPNMTVETNIAAGLSGSKKEMDETVREMVLRFHLEGLEKRYPGELSGGQQQRVALARILAYKPDVIMLDEPFSALDTWLREQLQMEVRRTIEGYSGDVLLVTHSRDELYRFCEKCVVLKEGHAAASGDTKEIFRRPANVTAARLTGCKNISRAKRLDSCHVLALDWGAVLRVPKDVSEEITHVGIRAHEFYPAGEKDAENRITCRWEQTMKDPFEWNLQMRPLMEDGTDARKFLWWKLDYKSVGLLEEKSEGDILTMAVPSAEILLLKEN